MVVRKYQEMRVWQKGMDLADACYDCTERFPARENFGLVAQIRRAAVSIPANIAEGQGRRYRKEFLRYLSIARGSLQELETLLLIALRRGFLSQETLDPIFELCDHLSRMIVRLWRALTR